MKKTNLTTKATREFLRKVRNGVDPYSLRNTAEKYAPAPGGEWINGTSPIHNANGKLVGICVEYAYDNKEYWEALENGNDTSGIPQALTYNRDFRWA